MNLEPCNIGIHTDTYDNIQVTYEYIGATFDGKRVIIMERVIFSFPFHFYMNVGHVLHTHESAASATHSYACDTYVQVRDPHTNKPDRNSKSRTHNPKLLLCYCVQENISMGYSHALNLVCNIEICVFFLTRSVPLY